MRLLPSTLLAIIITDIEIQFINGELIATVLAEISPLKPAVGTTKGNLILVSFLSGLSLAENAQNSHGFMRLLKLY